MPTRKSEAQTAWLISLSLAMLVLVAILQIQISSLRSENSRLSGLLKLDDQARQESPLDGPINSLSITDTLSDAKIQIGISEGQPFLRMYQAGITSPAFELFTTDQAGCLLYVSDPSPARESPTVLITASSVSAKSPGKPPVIGLQAK